MLNEAQSNPVKYLKLNGKNIFLTMGKIRESISWYNNLMSDSTEYTFVEIIVSISPCANPNRGEIMKAEQERSLGS